MIVTGSISYGDICSINRKNVCSMNSANGTNNTESNNSSSSSSSSSSSDGESVSGEESETETIRNALQRLTDRVVNLCSSCHRLNDPEIRAIADKIDRNIRLTPEER
jgi:hypothetical protein